MSCTTIDTNASIRNGGTASKAARYRHVQAKRVRRPEACGCGLPVAFDLENKEFFCTGCGAATVCVCRRSPLRPPGTPVNLA